MFALLGLASVVYGAYALIRLIMALIKKQETRPWLLKLGAAFFIFFMAILGSAPNSSSSTSTQKSDTVASTTPVQQKTPEELEQERKAKEQEQARQAALEQRKQEQEKKRKENQQKQKEWEKRQERERKEEERKREEAKRKGYTMEQFRKLQAGMSYRECVGILGSEGVLISESNIGQTYEWRKMNKFIILNFINGTLSTKAQDGLE